MMQPTDGTRREQILQTAARLFGATGIRTSVHEIAKACGILPGSLYHHFESKEAICVELVRRYQAELDSVAARTEHCEATNSPVLQQIIRLAEAIAECSVRHRAALLQTLYEPPATASKELVELTRRAPTLIDKAMLEILRSGRASGFIRRDIDLPHLAERICQGMLMMGIGLAQGMPGADQIPALKCRMLLDGISAEAPDNRALDQSNAFAVAQQVIAGWAGEDLEGRLGQLRRAARVEFGRRGFEATTIRDIASAAGISPGMVHHLAGSKDELLASIMETYNRIVAASWDAVLATPASPIEKLDALTWIDINVMDRFSEEYKIQMASLQQTPPTSTDHWANPRPAQLMALMMDGERSGQLRVLGGSADLRAHCLLELTWISESIVRTAGPRAALALARDTLLRGAHERQDADVS